MSQIITHSGCVVDVLNPHPEDIDIEDIAHALSNLCRWAGHSRYYYSVAQHSVIVSHHVPPEYALWGLLHDAAEAYLMDMPSPIKALLPEYAALEARMLGVISKRYGLSSECPAEVKIVDRRLRVTEAIELGLRPHLWGGLHEDPLPIQIKPIAPDGMRSAFLFRFCELVNY